jgi:hypothetical protein
MEELENQELVNMYKELETRMGLKDDSQKREWHLLPWDCLEEIVKVLEFGKKKYSEDNWKKVSLVRYKDALIRHFVKEGIDPDSSLSHAAHLAANAIFILYKELHKDENENKS